MASLNKLAIRGIRSFDDKQIAVIEFFSPVTVIVGHNGSGKTTVIECLKYATTGEQPPNTRGGAFVHDPKMANEKEVKAQVKLRFHAANGQRMLVVRNLSVSMKKNSGLTMKTLESILSLADGNVDKNGKRATISTKCAEMDVEIPNLLGVSKAVLENVIFCHQEDSYWPLSEPSVLKKKFDDIFEATRYTKALDAIKSLRKDRVSELKTDKERLEGLSREKGHADKLRERFSDSNSHIALKELQHEKLAAEYDALVLANKKFYDSATKFKEIYVTVENLQIRQQHMKDELGQAMEHVKELPDSDDDLANRLANFDRTSSQAKQRRLAESNRLQDAEEELVRLRKENGAHRMRFGELQNQERLHEQNIAARDEEIRKIATKMSIRGYDHVPLEREQILAFTTKLRDLRKTRLHELETLQRESKEKDKDYNARLRQLTTEHENLKLQRANLRDQISALQRTISSAEHELDKSQSHNMDLQAIQSDLKDKASKLARLKSDIQASKFDDKILEKTAQMRAMEEKRNAASTLLRSLSAQAEERAKLDLKRTETANKTQEIQNIITVQNPKFRKLIGHDIRQETMGRDLERVTNDTEREFTETEEEYATVNKALQQRELTISSMKAQVKQKKDELKALDRKLSNELDTFATIEEALKDATSELNLRKEESASLAGTSQVYEALLKTSVAKKACTTCNRALSDHELPDFEKHLKEKIKKMTPATIAQNKQEIDDWEGEVKRLQDLIPSETMRDLLKKTEIPKLEAKLKQEEDGLPKDSERAEAATDKVNEIKDTLKDLSSMRQHAQSVVKLQSEIQRLGHEVTGLEDQLSSSGSTKTADDVQSELVHLDDEIRGGEREKQGLVAERERQMALQRTVENDIHRLQLEESNLKTQLRDKELLEARIKSMRSEVVDKTEALKDVEEKVTAAQPPITQLEDEQKEFMSSSDRKCSQVREQGEELTRSCDVLDKMNKTIELYIREKRGRLLKQCEENIENSEAGIKDVETQIEGIRIKIADIDREISEGGAAVSNLRENLRIRKLRKDIVALKEKINSYDMEEAARAKRQFEEKYTIEKQRESDVQSQYAHLGGEISSLKSQLRQLEKDLKDFSDINKRYTDQLIKVKMSDMANNDLEKYAKALENAIMKYHTLKMEEVNDTMRHLWNKTYQGTDIDGIKIRSDVEGGATRRSYNYRVVMTKDQVEMDMRGRCSAGQKMLASIIIRLALSDSFGQNCGILALDEPTNALDLENIDALASSLVDIINERKNHANFQLIIITHDENFLRKLGQADVMEHYWRVSRDARQKSIIERQRFS